jgi:PilZ domain
MSPSSHRNKPSRHANQRSVRRCALVASVEVIELGSGAVLSARISELGVGGCYVDALNPFHEGALVRLRILRDQGVFETKAKVVYCHSSFGMGLAFIDVTPDQRSLLETWLAEIVTQLTQVS